MLQPKKLYFMGVALLILILSGAHAGHCAITLTSGGHSQYTIVLGEDASLSEQYGAHELQSTLVMISGAFIPIAKENERISGPKIFMGNSALLKNSVPRLASETFGDEEFMILTEGDNLVLTGGRLRGSMYAVFTFLEKYIGCSWYSPEANYIPVISSISIGEINDRQKPAFDSRETYWYEAHDPDWAARNKNNVYRRNPDILKGEDATYGGTHTFYQFIPPDDFFENHPEYFAILTNKREWRYSQLCLTNPELRKAATGSVLNWMAGQLPGTVAWVGQNDWHVYCICGKCAAQDKYEESHSGTLIHFVNFIGERVARTYPERKIGTLAYTYTEIPPKYVRPLDNVVIRLALIYGCEAHPMTECDVNIPPRENVKNWAPLAKNLWIWDYVTDFAHYLQPFPIWKTNQKDLLWYKEMGVDGIKEQGCTRTRAAAGSQLIAYLESRLLWDPAQDREAIIKEFLDGYYGKAAGPIRNFMALLEDKVLGEWIHFTLYSPPTTGLFTPDVISRADDYLEEAASAVSDDPARSYRVEEVMMNMMYVKLAYPVRHILAGNVYAPAPETPAYATLRNLDRFIELCKKHGMAELREARGYDWTYNFLRANLGTHEIVPLENSDLRLDLVPGIGGRVAQFIDKPSGANILRIPAPDEPTYPAVGGYSEGPATTEQFAYTVNSPGSGPRIMLEGILPYREVSGALRISREMSLAASGSEVQIIAEMECLKQLERPIRLQTMPDLDLGNPEKLMVGVKTGDGNFTFATMPKTDEKGSSAITFFRRDLQAGEWIVINSEDKRGLINTFDPEGVEEAQFSINTKTGQALMSLRGIQKIMAPGEKLVIRHALKYVKDASSLLP